MSTEITETDEGYEGKNKLKSSSINIKKAILDTIYFYGISKELSFENTPQSLPQFPLFVGNSVRTIVFWAKFNKFY